MKALKKTALFMNPTGTGGLAHYANEFCNALALQLDHVVLLCFDRFEVPPEFRHYELKQLTLETIQSKRKRLFFSLLLMLKALVVALSLTLKNRPAVVFINGYSSPFDWFYCRLRPKNTPVYCIQHEVEPRVGNKSISWFQSDFYRHVTGFILHTYPDPARPDKSELLLREKYHVQGRIVKIKFGLYSSDIFGGGVSARPPEGSSILSFGAVRKDKGTDVLVRAYPGSERCGGLRLVIAGKSQPNYTAAMETALQECGHNQDVKWVNQYIPLAETASYYNEAAFAVFPFIICRQSASLRLALFFDKPCIVTETGEPPFLVRQYGLGLVVPPNDVDALRAAIVKLSLDAKLREECVANIQRLNADPAFSWTVIVKEALAQIMSDSVQAV